MRPTDWLIIAIAGTAFGASFGLNEILLRDLGPLTISALRVGIAALGCWVWMLTRPPGDLAVGSSRTRLALLGFFQFALPFALLPFAQLHITSSVAGIANALTPIATLILSLVLVTGEKMSIGRAFGMTFGALGSVVLVSGNSAGTGSDPFYVALALAATFSYAIALNIAKGLGQIKATAAITWALSFGFLFMLPLALVVEGVPGAVSPETLTSILALGLGLTALPFMVLYSMMTRVGAVNVSLVTFVAPVSALIIGVSYFDEPATLANLTGAALVLLGLLVIDGRVFKARLLRSMAEPQWPKPRLFATVANRAEKTLSSR